MRASNQSTPGPLVVPCPPLLQIERAQLTALPQLLSLLPLDGGLWCCAALQLLLSPPPLLQCLALHPSEEQTPIALLDAAVLGPASCATDWPLEG